MLTVAFVIICLFCFSIVFAMRCGKEVVGLYISPVSLFCCFVFVIIYDILYYILNIMDAHT